MLRRYLRLTLVEAWNAAASSGSMAIIRFFFLVTWTFRSSICSLTQPLKTSPSTVAQTLQIHSLETLWISCWSGKKS